MLTGFRGYLQTDGYSGYRRLADSEPITAVVCLAHVRRKFVEMQRATLAGASPKAKWRKADAALESTTTPVAVAESSRSSTTRTGSSDEPSSAAGSSKRPFQYVNCHGRKSYSRQ